MIFKRFSSRPLILLTIIYILLIILLGRPATKTGRPDYPAPDETSRVTGVVITPPERSAKNSSFILDTITVNETRLQEKILVYSSAQTSGISPGNIVEISGVFQQPKPAMNFGSFDHSKYLSGKGIYLIFYADSVNDTGRSRINFYRKASFKLREKILAAINKNLPGTEADILSKMLIGSPSYIQDSLRRKFTDAGVIHVLVVSGMNVAYFTGMIIFFFRLFGLPFRKAALFTIPFVPVFTIMAGAQDPVMRASIMALYLLAALSMAREPCIYQSLALSALTILALNPLSLFGASFQLSFAATIGIIYFYPLIFGLFKNFKAWLRIPAGVFAVSLAAQIAVLPILAFYFNKISLVGFLSNMFIVPLAGLITVTGLMLCFIQILLPLDLIVLIIAKLNLYLIKLLILSVDFFSSFPHATMRVFSPSFAAIAAYYALAAALFKFKSSYTAKAVTILAGVVLAASWLYQPARRAGLEISILDMGGANFIHASFPDSKNLLINCGQDSWLSMDQAERTILPYLLKKRTRAIDTIILSNLQKKNTGSLEPVLSNFRVRQALTPPILSAGPGFEKTMSLMAAKNIKLKEVWADEKYYISGSTIIFIAPGGLDMKRDSNSLIFLLEYDSRRLLFLTDITKQTEKALAASLPYMKTDVIVMPDNGMRKLSKEFLGRFDPDWFVVPTGLKKPGGTAGLSKNVFLTKTNGQVDIRIKNGKLELSSAR